ncbi:potassium channel family protein [Planobispora takensis]|uniref:Metal transporter n=1 Tax=Planobispora takensis TaxID=1367882 RepID=A0A8J3T3A1_9ACTN|nr:potassium channel family protein [Planobispora takensis]GII05282.1 metal transporter [Planobispora takensis]
MDGHGDGDLPRRVRRRLVLRAALRSAGIAACLLTGYFTLPMDGEFTVVSLFALVAGLLLLCGIVAWQAYAITRADHPRMRAIEALVTSVMLFLLLFATAYHLMSMEDPSSFSEPLTRADALYFTVTVFATVGFGDIVPRTQLSRMLTTTQMIGGLILVGLVAKVFLEAVQRGLRRRDDDADGDG